MKIVIAYGRRIKKRSFPFGAPGSFFDASEVFQQRSSQQRSVQSEWSWRAMYVPWTLQGLAIGRARFLFCA